jgi:hypothetical protein
VSNVSLMPVASEPAAAACTSCGAPLAADQRYCLTCGQPCSPVRLAFLDVLQERPEAAAPPPPPSWATPSTIELGPSGYLPVFEPGPNGWLRRYSGLLGLFSVLLLCLLVGLLVGHWATQGSKAPAKQVVEVKGLSGLAAPAAASPTSTTSASSAAPAEAKASAKEEAEESKEAAKETKAEKAPPAKPVTVTPTKLKKLTKTTGKKHQEEINALGTQPIEVR